MRAFLRQRKIPKLNMNTTDELVIEYSKKKMIFIVVGSCVFLAGTAWMLTLDDEYIRASHNPFLRDPLFLRAVAVVGVLGSAFGVIFGVKKLFDKKPGLVLNSAGIIDNTSAFSAGFIPWSDIVGAEEHVLPRNKKMLVIKLANPETYIARGGPL